jgi:cephalosporin-C deacetylase-like acetyl esterase
MLVLCSLCAGAADLVELLAYRKLPTKLSVRGREKRDGALILDVTFASLSGGRTAAYLVAPARKQKAKSPAMLFVHWYEPESKYSNRTQFLDEAVVLAGSGAVSLLIETMWSDPKWFPRRKREDDFDHSVQQLKDLRRALDVLLTQPGVDRERVAYAGHDFGAMYGAVLPAVDKRVKVYALQAGTGAFPNWYLYGPKMDAESRARFVARFQPLDPVTNIGAASPAPVLFQFGRSDPHVPVPNAEAFYAAARQPKKILWYDAGHGLNPQAVADRIAWLKEQLKLQ